jgi:hypothetical protein
MKAKSFAIVLALVALGGWCLWQGRVFSNKSAAPSPKREATAETQSAREASSTRSARAELSDGFADRLEAELTFASAESDPIRQGEKAQMIIDALSFDEIPATLAFLQRQEQTELVQNLQVQLIRKGAATDPQAAADWAQQIPASTTRSDAIAGVGIIWANQNLQDAARWASQLAEGEDREVGLKQVAYEASRSDPAFALKLISDLAPNDARDELTRHAARQWAAQAPKDALSWANELTNPTLREQIVSDIAATWGETDPRAAAELALQSLASGRAQEDALVGIAQQWVQKEPERAAAWVFEFPESFQPTALENVLKIWAVSDSPRATKWAENLPAGMLRDTALAVLAAR